MIFIALGVILVFFVIIPFACYLRVFYLKRQKPLKPDEYAIPEEEDYLKIKDQLIKWIDFARSHPYEVFETRLLEARGPWGNVLPLVFRRYACRELCLMEQSLETEGVLEEAILQAEKKALSAIPPGARILSKESRMTPLENGAVRLELIYITEEEIGVSLPIQQE